MKNLFFWGASFLIIVLHVESKEPKYSDSLLTADDGIVTADDLAYDHCRREIVPYNPNTAFNSLYWQCLPVKDVKPTYRIFRDNDPMGAWDVVITMCHLELNVNHKGEKQVYVDRRGHHVEYCKDFVQKWLKLTKDQEIVCLSGSGGEYYFDEKGGKYKLWTWEKFKTKKGCHSYFFGDCTTSGYSKKKCYSSK
ncbi:MAG: hypothetical protein HY390_07940 [Deltaproteobacteria bacterium]|nr:hypothetical protein [Deltaproteobacteria bacterium]